MGSQQGRHRVNFYSVCSGEPAKVGSLVWDGSALTAEPPDEPALQNVLAEPVRVPDGKGAVTSEQPEKFLAALRYNYRSAYFQAGDVQEE